jgi:hypothetical protein
MLDKPAFTYNRLNLDQIGRGFFLSTTKSSSCPVIDLFLGPLEAEEAVQVEVVEGVEMMTQPFNFYPF